MKAEKKGLNINENIYANTSKAIKYYVHYKNHNNLLEFPPK